MGLPANRSLAPDVSAGRSFHSLRSSVSSVISTRKSFINPDSSFVDFSRLKNEIYTADGMRNAQDYDPYSKREVKKPITDFETYLHLLNGSMGAGMLAMPQAFRNAGVIVGVFGTILLGVCCLHSVNTMMHMQMIQCKRLRVPFLTLPRSMRIALLNGPQPLRKLAQFAPTLVDLFLVVYQLGMCTVYVVFIAQSVKDLVEPHLIKGIDLRHYMLMIFVPILLINFIRNLKNLVLVSLGANIITAIELASTLYYIFSTGYFRLNEVRLVATAKTWPLFVGTALFALESIGMIIALEHNMKNPQHFLGWKGVFPNTMTFVISLNTLVGLILYLKYGNTVQETLVSILPLGERILGRVIEGMNAICILGSYPLQCFVSLEILWGNYLEHHIKDPVRQCCSEYILRILVVTFTFMLAIVIPYVEIVISLVGSFCLSTLVMIFPFLLELCTLWPDQLGRYHYIFLKDIFFIILGFFILLTGSYVSIIHKYIAN